MCIHACTHNIGRKLFLELLTSQINSIYIVTINSTRAHILQSQIKSNERLFSTKLGKKQNGTYNYGYDLLVYISSSNIYNNYI